MDPEGIRTVVTNLVMNAIEATQGNEAICVSTGAHDDWVILTVRDEGAGMSEEFIARSLFQPFQTTKKQGLGIGLFHCRNIVDAHHGRMEVESRVGEGSTFRVILPLRGSAESHEDGREVLGKNQ